MWQKRSKSKHSLTVFYSKTNFWSKFIGLGHFFRRKCLKNGFSSYFINSRFFLKILENFLFLSPSWDLEKLVIRARTELGLSVFLTRISNFSRSQLREKKKEIFQNLREKYRIYKMNLESIFETFALGKLSQTDKFRPKIGFRIKKC